MKNIFNYAYAIFSTNFKRRRESFPFEIKSKVRKLIEKTGGLSLRIFLISIPAVSKKPEYAELDLSITCGGVKETPF